MRMKLLLATLCMAVSVPVNADVTQLFSPADFTASLLFSNNFESGTVDVSGIDILSDSIRSPLILSTVSQGGSTSSEPHYLFNDAIGGTSSINVPLVAFTAPGAFEIGMFFGNDQLAGVVATLSVFDSADALLGQVAVAGNGNDLIDQFIGLRSTSPFARAELNFGATALGEAIDDITVGVRAVPSPGSVPLIILGLLAAGLRFIPRKGFSALPR